MRGAGRIQRAAAGVGHMGCDGHHLQVVEERGYFLAAARHAEGNHAAGSVRHVLFGQCVILVRFQTGEAHPADAWIGFKPLGHGQGVGTVAFHTYSEGFQMHAHDP